MPTPPSNPLTMLRKLGTSLIGQDGLLTTAASTALGYSPMDRIKTRLAAQSEVQGQEKFKQEQDLAARRAEADRLALETNTYNLGRTKTVNAQADAERAAKGAQLAGAMVPGPPNPDGSPIISPDAAIGMAEGKLTQYGLDKASGQETMTPALANELKNLGMDPGVQVGEKFDTSQLDRALQARNFNEATKARIQASRDAADARQIQRESSMDLRRQQLQNNIIGSISTALQSNEAYKKYVSVGAESNGLKTLLQNAETDPNGTSDIAIVNMFQRLADPGVAVREGDVALIQSAQGLIPRVANIADWVYAGNRLAPETRANMLRLIDPIVEARKRAAQETAQPFRIRAREAGIHEDTVFPQGFFPSSSGAAPSGADPFAALDAAFPRKKQ